MFHRFLNLMQMRRSTAFLLARGDDRLLDDIGLTRDDLAALHMGAADDARWIASFQSPLAKRALPVAC
jgi:dephospho-CoA kinase